MISSVKTVNSKQFLKNELLDGITEALERASKKIPHGNKNAPNVGSSLGKAVHAKDEYKEDDKQPTKVTESADALADSIKSVFSGKENLKIGKPSTHSVSGQSGIKKYHVYPVTYSSGSKTYASYAHHEEGSTAVKLGMPKIRGGESKTVS